MRKQSIGVLFVTVSAILASRFVSGWEQLASIVLLWSVAAFMHIRAVQYLPTISFSLAIIVVVPIIALHGITWAVCSALIMGCFHAVLFERHWQALARSWLNYGTSTLLAGLAFSLFGGEVGFLPVPRSLWPLTMSAVAYSVANVAIASLFFARQNQRSLGLAIQSLARASWLNYLAVTYVGSVLAVFSNAFGIVGLIMFSGVLIAIMELLQINTRMHSERNQRLQAQAELRIDSKTGVYNFRRLHDWLSDDCGSQTSLLFIDIDDFKRLNDRYGHGVGDEVLQSVAKTIRSNVREMDNVIRFGGEEFVVIIPGADGHAALVVAERIKTEIEQSTGLNPSNSVTVSIGVASLATASDKHDLLLLADRAMYQAKAMGKNRCFLWDGLTKPSRPEGADAC